MNVVTEYNHCFGGHAMSNKNELTNILIMADYQAPKSGNFLASQLELGIKVRSLGYTVVDPPSIV